MKKIINRYLVLIVFIAVTLIGLAIRYLTNSSSWLWELWGVIDVSFAVALGVMAFLAYKEFISAENEVKIYFNVEGKEISTGLWKQNDYPIYSKRFKKFKKEIKIKF
jgi:hypothetical protein